MKKKVTNEIYELYLTYYYRITIPELFILCDSTVKHPLSIKV